MKTSQHEIIVALNTIKRVCEKQEIGCQNCPLRTWEDPNRCVLKRDTPILWKIKEENEIWRAFECRE